MDSVKEQAKAAAAAVDDALAAATKGASKALAAGVGAAEGVLDQAQEALDKSKVRLGAVQRFLGCLAMLLQPLARHSCAVTAAAAAFSAAAHATPHMAAGAGVLRRAP